MKYLLIAILLISSACGKKQEYVDQYQNETTVNFMEGVLMLEPGVFCNVKKLYGRLYLDFCDTSPKTMANIVKKQLDGNYDIRVSATNAYLDIEITFEGLPIHPDYLKGSITFSYE